LSAACVEVIASVTLLSLSLDLSAPEKAATAMPKIISVMTIAQINSIKEKPSIPRLLEAAELLPAREESEIGLFIITLRILFTIRLIVQRVRFRRPF
jgi:hypothetical protein